MKLNRTPNPLDRSARNGENDNWDIIEGEVRAIGDRVDNFVDEVSEDAYNKLVEDARLDWREMVDEYSDLPTNARKGTTVGVKNQGIIYRYNGNSWDRLFEINLNPIAEVDDRLTSQLETTNDKLLNVNDSTFYNTIDARKNIRSIISFVDDDSHSAVWDELKPVVEQEKIPINLAVITGQVGDNGRLTLEQLKDLQKIGFETSSHTHDHINLRQSTEAEQDYQLRTSRNWLRDNGFEYDAIVYPYGGRDATTQKIAKRYFKAGIYIDNGQKLNNNPISSFDLQRVYFNDAPGDAGFVQRCKDKIDQAISTNAWIIIGMHCHYSGFDKNKLIEVIQYAKQKEIEIVSVKEGIETFGNIIDLPSFQVDALGNVTLDSFARYRWLSNSINVDNTSPLSSYYRGTSVKFLNSTENGVAGFGRGGAVILYTHRSRDDRESYQELVEQDSGNRLIRFWSIPLSNWTDWQYASAVFTRVTRTINVGIIPANSTKDFNFINKYYNADDNTLILDVLTTPPSGIMFNNFNNVSGNTSTSTIRVANVTNSDIDCGSIDFRTWVFTKEPL